MQEASFMVRSFLLMLATSTLIALLLRRVGVPSYAGRVGVVALAGVAAAVRTDLGDVVWWYLPLDWKLHQGVYTFTAWLVPGLVLARFTAPEEDSP